MNCAEFTPGLNECQIVLLASTNYLKTLG